MAMIFMGSVSPTTIALPSPAPWTVRLWMLSASSAILASSRPVMVRGFVQCLYSSRSSLSFAYWVTGSGGASSGTGSASADASVSGSGSGSGSTFLAATRLGPGSGLSSSYVTSESESSSVSSSGSSNNDADSCRRMVTPVGNGCEKGRADPRGIRPALRRWGETPRGLPPWPVRRYRRRTKEWTSRTRAPSCTPTLTLASQISGPSRWQRLQERADELSRYLRDDGVAVPRQEPHSLGYP